MWQAEDEDEFFRSPNLRGDRQTDGEGGTRGSTRRDSCSIV